MADQDKRYVQLDLSPYTTPERSLELAAHGCPQQYTEIAKEHMAARQLHPELHAFRLSRGEDERPT